jgi:phosphoribosyl 1,2-cyclic phosphodiesterase
MVLPNGQKKVRIALTGSRDADETAAKAAAKLEDVPRGYMWHHNEDMTMSIVPEDLHRAIEHSGGVAEYKHRTGVDYVD